MKRIFLLSSFFLLIFFSFSKNVLATILFQDNFDDGDANGWERIYTNGPDVSGNWQVKNQKYGITISSKQTITETVATGFVGNNYKYKVELLGIQGTDKNIHFKFQDNKNWYGVHGTLGKLYIEKVIGGTDFSGQFSPINYNFENGTQYNFKFVLFGNNIQIYINNELKFDVVDPTPHLISGKIGMKGSTGEIAPTEVWFDNVMVCSLDDPCGDAVPTLTPTPTETPTPTPTNTPTPTPTPTPKIPVIIIPGHGACFSREGILEGQDYVPQEKWKILSFVHEYDGLINSIKNSGYQPGEDLFVFCYDWRKKIDQTSDILKDFILNKVLVDRTDTDQTKIVGHSMGGLVGRSFAQKNNGSNLERLITAGSPNKGVIQTYYPWEGGELYEEKNFQWIAWQLLIQSQKKNFTTNVETVRKVAPSTQNLLPTFNFLKDKNTSAELDFRALNQKNDWLYFLNESLPDPPFLDKSIAVVGLKGDTPAWYKIVNRSWLDKLLGKWEDGKPAETEYEIGDLTVLEKSAKIPDGPYESLNLDHGELIRTTQGIRKIMEILNISEVKIEEGSKFELTPSLIFALGSPANVIVTVPDGTSFSGNEEKLVFIPQASVGIYNVQIIPEEPGNFRLFIGQETESGSSWKEIDETINTTPLNYLINFNPKKPIENPILDSTGKTYLDLALEKILLLKNDYRHPILNQVLKAINECRRLIANNKNFKASQKVEEIIKMLFKFRKDNSIPKARNLSFEAIELLEKAYEILINNSGQSINPSEIKAKIKFTQNFINSTERTLKILEKKNKLKPDNGVSFELAREEFEKAKKNFEGGNLPGAKIQLSITQSLLQESLIIK